MIDPDEIEEDIGGMQGEEKDREEVVPSETNSESGADVQAPDAGEIEWAGGLVKKAPGA